MQKPVFTYFDGRGHGERVRYALAAAGIDYVESALKMRSDFEAVSPRCLFGQVPLLEGLEEGQSLGLVQSWSIVRFLARYNDLTPSDPYLAFRADACAELVRDWTEQGGFVGYGWSDKDAGKAKMLGACLKFLPKFEGILSPFCCGEKVCWADYQLLFIANYASEVLDAPLKMFPKVSALRDTLNKEAAIAEFLANRAKGLVDEKYMREVDTVLQR